MKCITKCIESYANIVTKTARYTGAVGKKAVVPRYVANIASFDDEILDFGSGSKAIHVQMLKNQGFNVTAWDLGKNFVKGIHSPDALKRQYDIVYASNVLNVQPSRKYLEIIVKKLIKLVKSKGKLVVYYPINPRKSDVTEIEIEELLRNNFKMVERVGGSKKAPLFLCVK